ncbi:UNVERIFIED_CONTAM: hypothetical protein HDU68_010817 [Siphonaria sp. JEL0065]|nr:hypothetical protein HDU68_010817 [Siphonaria sp. JEL0065]
MKVDIKDYQYVWYKTEKPAVPPFEVTLDYHSPSLLKISRRVKANYIAYKILHELPSIKTILQRDIHIKENSTQTLLEELERVVFNFTSTIYPWLSTENKPISIHQLQLQYLASNKSGIVMTSGRKHFKYLLHAITSLRTVLNCALPIEVHFGGDGDLPKEMIQHLHGLTNVSTVDLLLRFPSEIRRFDGWSLKPFAMLASGMCLSFSVSIKDSLLFTDSLFVIHPTEFRNVIFIDTDVLFFKDPAAILINSPIFTQYGQLFFHDRNMQRELLTSWFKTNNPHLSRYSSMLRYAKNVSYHEQESGVVVLDKSRSGILHSLLFVCKLNSIEVREETYRNMYGDKETFWMGMELTRVPFRFVPGFSGALGYRNNTRVCGSLFHTDEMGRPLWWNGGILMKKHKSDEWFMKFEAVAVDTDFGKEKWEAETNWAPYCFTPVHPSREVRKVSMEEQMIGKEYIRLWKSVKEDYQKVEDAIVERERKQVEWDRVHHVNGF